MTRLRTAIVGAGLMGRWHGVYAQQVGADVVAIVDRDPDAARRLQRRFPRAQVLADVEAAVRAVDVVHICTPPSTHAVLAETVVRHGGHVVLEKPVAENADAAAALFDLADRQNRLVTVAHQFPFQRGIHRLRTLLPALGDMVRIDFRASTAAGDGANPDERRDVLREILPHPLSLVRALTDRPLGDVEWRCLRWDDEAHEIAGRSGRTSLHIVIDLRGRPPCNEIAVTGTEASARADLYHGFMSWHGRGPGRLGKIVRPFLDAAALGLAASVNLTRRALTNEPAFPGLRELIAAHYRAVARNDAGPVAAGEVLEIARLIDRLDCDSRESREASEHLALGGCR